MPVEYTRTQYMQKQCTHDEYYGQFAPGVCHMFDARMRERIAASTDPHLNDIPLATWDRLAGVISNHVLVLIGEANGNGGISLSDRVCTLKAAAKLIKQEMAPCTQN